MIEKFSVAQVTTPDLDFCEALKAYVEADIGGIGIWEEHFGSAPDTEKLKHFIGSGLKATLAVPRVWSILPNPWIPEPADPRRRIELMCESVLRLASFDPVAIGLQTGPVAKGNESHAWDVIESGLRQLARVAADVHPRGINIAIEPVHPALRSQWSPVTSLAQAAELLERLDEPGLKIVLDAWHLADDPDLDSLRRCIGLIAIVQIADRTGPKDSWRARQLPGDGNIELLSLVQALDQAEFTGWYELEIVSDDGRLGQAVPHSLWTQPHDVLLKAAQTRFRELHRAAIGVAAD